MLFMCFMLQAFNTGFILVRFDCVAPAGCFAAQVMATQRATQRATGSSRRGAGRLAA